MVDVDHYASQVLNEVIGVDKPVTEAVSFPPILPREPEKFGSSNRSVGRVGFLLSKST